MTSWDKFNLFASISITKRYAFCTGQSDNGIVQQCSGTSHHCVLHALGQNPALFAKVNSNQPRPKCVKGNITEFYNKSLPKEKNTLSQKPGLNAFFFLTRQKPPSDCYCHRMSTLHISERRNIYDENEILQRNFRQEFSLRNQGKEEPLFVAFRCLCHKLLISLHHHGYLLASLRNRT